MKKTAIIVSGYFNPVHKGHLEYFEKAKVCGDLLFVIINSDFQRKLKGSKEFQDEKERLLIISSLRIVDKTFLSIDKDKTVIETISKIHHSENQKYHLCFANGGDQNNNKIPEKNICQKLGIKLLDGLGEKIQSSSWLLKKT
ncbi:MAG: cytidyltransferase [Flavobacteriales bacterium]|jgi:cytidyltransferase-like protein|nr:cytidyltransferase [Flavobacteriales bacterium]|tara:strand:- start:1387 stop:1812 length:426 start_codon:yes stop_codon:yes gene_type:complete